jgi:hypothetical protein
LQHLIPYSRYPERDLDHGYPDYQQNRRKAKRNELDDTADKKRIIAVYQKLQEIYELLKFANPITSQDELNQKQLLEHKNKNNNDIHHHSVIETLEIAKEITFLYYLTLNRDVYIPVLFSIPGFEKMLDKSALARVTKKPKDENASVRWPLSLKENLSKILRQDQEIRDWLYLCMSDLIFYQNEAAKIMSLSYDQIKK